MGLGRYVVDAITLEGRSPTELARSHDISRTWIYELLARYRAGGYPAIEPRSRRPRSCAHQTAPKVERAVLRLRRDLTAAGHDAGPHTIAHHLAGRVARGPPDGEGGRRRRRLRRGSGTLRPAGRRAHRQRCGLLRQLPRWQGP